MNIVDFNTLPEAGWKGENRIKREKEVEKFVQSGALLCTVDVMPSGDPYTERYAYQRAARSVSKKYGCIITAHKRGENIYLKRAEVERKWK